MALPLCLGVPGISWAQATEEEQRAACGPDVLEFCAAEVPNRSRIAQCLRAKRSQISPECRAMLDGAGQQ